MKRALKSYLLFCLMACVLSLSACGPLEQLVQQKPGDAQETSIGLSDVPEYSGSPYVVLKDNRPDFTKEDLTEVSFEEYRELDALGRCQEAYANVGQDLMPTEKRGDIGKVKPTGWHSVEYDIVDGKHLYNRCHLIGYQLTAENANEKNLITGTRYMNVDGMLPFENMVADYVKETGFHVLYRVTPVFEGDDLVAKGVEMEAYSVEDEGEGVCFHVFVYNVQPGISIDYATGESSLGDETAIKGDAREADASQKENAAGEGGGQKAEDGEESSLEAEAGEDSSEMEIRGNQKSKIYHCPGQAAYEQMGESKNLVIFHSEQEAQEAGYRKAKR